MREVVKRAPDRAMRKFILAGGGIAIAAAAGYFYFQFRQAPLDLSDIEPYPATAAENGSADLGAFLDAVLAQTDLPAAGAIVVTDDGVVASGFRGVMRSDASATVDLENAVHLGSLTKAMTAIVAAMLVEDGVIDWTTTPIDVLTLTSQEFDPAWRNVTLEMLLRMTGGVSHTDEINATFDRWIGAPDRAADPVRQRAEIAQAILARAPAYEPGSKQEYSNFSYALAGHMLETAAGVEFERLMRDRLFAPLGLRSAGFGAPAGGDAVWGHEANGAPVAPSPAADNPAMLSPAGRVHMSIPDYGAFMQFVMRGARGDSELLPASRFRELFEPATVGSEPYAMGWEVRDEAGPNVITLAHTGSNTLWYAFVWIVPEKGIGVFAAANRGSAQRELDAVVWRLVLAEYDRRAAQ